ncbi:MAG: response regulator transcription factor [Bacteroidales bacterium]|nr:response regulator transcription factor [Bacteroidales bacterium]
MHGKHDRIRILIVEKSTILTNGIHQTIESVVDCPVRFMEVSENKPIKEIIDFQPDIVIMNPIYGHLLDMEELKNEIPEIHFLGIITGPIDPSLLAGYEANIHLYDTPDDIHKAIDRIMGYDHHYSPKEQQLTEREKEIIIEVVKGQSNKEIADALNLSTFTVTTHRRNIARKLQIRSASALTIYALTNNLVSMEDVKI